MKPSIPKTEAQKKIEEFFLDIKNKTPKEISKIKRLAMNKKISLKEKRKFLCRHCLTPYSGDERIRINKGMKSIECLKCRKVNRWKIK